MENQGAGFEVPLRVLARRVPFLLVAAVVGYRFRVAMVLAYLVYEGFSWFDGKEADPKKRLAISEWLKGRFYEKLDLRLLVLAAFDRLYGSRLVSIRGLFRAMLVTVLAWVGYLCFVAAMTSPALRVRFFTSSLFIETFPCVILGWVICDYISLVIIRRYLSKSLYQPIFSLIVAFIIGTFNIALSYVIIQLICFLTIPARHLGISPSPTVIYEGILNMVGLVLIHPYWTFRFIEPALWVHIWLLLFALGAAGYRLICWFFQAVVGVQSVIRQGDKQPIRASGMVAAVLVFFGALVWLELS